MAGAQGMKTLEELKEGIRNLQALAEGMQGDISEVIRAGEIGRAHV